VRGRNCHWFGEMFMHTRSIKSRAGDHSAKIGGRPLWSPYCSQPSARFRNWCRGGRFRRRGRRGHVFVDEIPDRHRDEKRDQLRAPVFQRQSGPQDGNQYRAPVLRDLFLHNCNSNPKFNTLARTARGKTDCTFGNFCHARRNFCQFALVS